MNTPIISIIGQPNVGKSSLFNTIAGKKTAIVSAKSGVTRDRQFTKIYCQNQPVWLVDTAGIADSDDKLSASMQQQTQIAAEQADLILIVVDANLECHHRDVALVRSIQKSGTPCVLIINKVDLTSTGDNPDFKYAKLGIKNIIHTSCKHKTGIEDITDYIVKQFPNNDEKTEEEDHNHIAIVGKPNAGKSTLTNYLAKEDRCIVSSVPGTTRDAIELHLSHQDQPYILIDTAGMRKKARIHEDIEQYATAKTLRAIDKADVVVHLIDATENIARQDFRIIHLCLDLGKGVIVAINKTDCLNQYGLSETKKDVIYALKHIPNVPIIELSATTGRNCRNLIKQSLMIANQLKKKYSTSQLTRVLEKLVKTTPPPSRLGRPINLRMAHVSRNIPLEITIHGKRTSYLPQSYIRYLTNGFIAQLKLKGLTVKLHLKCNDNPYV